MGLTSYSILLERRVRALLLGVLDGGVGCGLSVVVARSIFYLADVDVSPY